MLIFLLFLFSLLFFIFARRCFRVALLMVVFLLPSYLIRFDILGVDFTLLSLLIWLCFAVFVSQRARELSWKEIRDRFQHRAREFLSLRMAILFFLGISLIALSVSSSPLASDFWRWYFLEPLLFFSLCVATFKDQQDTENIVRALGISVLVIFAFGIFQKFTAWKLLPMYLLDGSVNRVTSIYGYPNAIGLYAGPLVVLFVGWLLFKMKNAANTFCVRNMAVYGIAALSGLIAIILAKSDGALFGVIGALFFLGLALKDWRRITMSMILLFVFVTMGYAPLRSFFLQRVTFSGWSERVRVTMWRETLPLIRDHWFLGVGLGGYPIEFVPYHKAWHIEIFQYPHNIILNFWVEMGLVGLFAFLWLLFEYGRLCWRLIQKGSIGVQVLGWTFLAVMLEMIIHGLVDVPYFKNDLAALFWIFMAMALILSRDSVYN